MSSHHFFCRNDKSFKISLLILLELVDGNSSACQRVFYFTPISQEVNGDAQSITSIFLYISQDFSCNGDVSSFKIPIFWHVKSEQKVKQAGAELCQAGVSYAK